MKRPMSLVDDLHAISEENLIVLTYAARLMASVTDREILLSNGMECIGDFCRGLLSAILTWDEDRGSFMVERLFADKQVLAVKLEVPLADLPAADSSVLTRAKLFALRFEGRIPLPGTSEDAPPDRCLCLPLVAAGNRLVGICTIALNGEKELTLQDMQDLRVLTTVLAVTLENALLFRQALCDGLTGTYVRRYFEIRMNEELSRLKRKGNAFSILFLDIDGFKTVNDRLGHQVGDRVLAELAQLLKSEMRQGVDVICRYGGDEFIVLMPDTDLEAALTAGERIRERCSSTSFESLPGDLGVTLSGGLASADAHHALSPDELFNRADAMLYRAKEGGGNRIVAWPGKE
ncbi:GGDEF domain-containing protein [Syntrophobacter fumaroxidans]|uniref:diguanylate cyclase n=1 Tax=Syntrophobacter fumaroxidans (strain DSM 10017 / MPOB) TaxID=335543 RepID=A0LLM6_SYNFM|nr:sensor domain-containing diguanylate cyclase [Syntrophobacter fumaroxidans]ABK18328.1 diguanylate cyclase [Syntrophobacter fumaroxidans MPOB]